MNNIKDKLTVWLQNNIDFALFLAVFTETPRWTVVFVAVHESVFIGIPLGVLLAFATSKAWRTYFETKDRNLLYLNISSMVIAVLVIAPVLFAMTKVEAKDVQIANVLNTPLVWIWAFLLALTTFIPLGQLAFVQGIEQKQSEQFKPTAKRITRTVRQTVEQSEQFDEPAEQYTVQESEQLPVVTIEQPVQIDLSSLTTEQKKEYALRTLRTEENVNKSALMRQLDVSRSTFYGWAKELAP